MATLDDVRTVTSALPEVTEGEHGHDHLTGWKVAGKAFVWVRPLRPRDVADLEARGEPVPAGEIVAVRVPVTEKEAVLATVAGAFHVPHFDGFAAVLVELAAIDVAELRELVTDGWLAQAPKRVAKAFLDGGGA